MRQLLSLGLAVFLSFPLFADKADLFHLDEAKLDTTFKEVNALDAYLETHPEATMSSLELEENVLFTNVDFYFPDPNDPDAFQPPMGIPSFWWGFGTGFLGGGCGPCLTAFIPFSAPLILSGVVGVAVVHQEGGDKEEVKKAVIGCVTGTATGIILSVAALVALILWLDTGIQ